MLSRAFCNVVVISIIIIYKPEECSKIKRLRAMLSLTRGDDNIQLPTLQIITICSLTQPQYSAQCSPIVHFQ